MFSCQLSCSLSLALSLLLSRALLPSLAFSLSAHASVMFGHSRSSALGMSTTYQRVALMTKNVKRLQKLRESIGNTINNHLLRTSRFFEETVLFLRELTDGVFSPFFSRSRSFLPFLPLCMYFFCHLHTSISLLSSLPSTRLLSPANPSRLFSPFLHLYCVICRLTWFTGEYVTMSNHHQGFYMATQVSDHLQ